MTRYAMVIDTVRCVGCSDCVAACKTENKVPAGYARMWIVEKVDGQFPHLSMQIRSERCHHCSEPPCVGACPCRASHIHEPGGIVLVDHALCSGCKACVAACPYDARFMNPTGFADKCTFCVHRVEQGKKPACVSVCPTYCLHFGDLDDPLSEVSQLIKSRKFIQVIPDAGTRPNLYFLV